MRSIVTRVAVVAQRDGLAGVQRAVDHELVGQRQQDVLVVEGLQRVDERDRHEPARRDVRAGAAQEPAAGRRGRSSCTVCIGAMTSAKSRRASAKSAASATTVAHVQALGAGAPLELGQQRGVDVERDDVVAAAREVERDAAGAGADVEDRPVAPRRRARARAPGRRRSGRTRRRARRRARGGGSCERPLRRAARDEQLAQREHRGVRRQRDEPARRRRRARRRAPRLEVGLDVQALGRRRRRTSAAARARPRACRCTSRGARAPAITSKSASHTQEMSRPSAILSLRTASTSCSPGSSASVRSTSLAPAGFLTSRIARSRPAICTVSARPNAACVRLQPGDDVGQRRAERAASGRRRRARCRRCRGRGGGGRRSPARRRCAARSARRGCRRA